MDIPTVLVALLPSKPGRLVQETRECQVVKVSAKLPLRRGSAYSFRFRQAEIRFQDFKLDHLGFGLELSILVCVLSFISH